LGNGGTLPEGRQQGNRKMAGAGKGALPGGIVEAIQALKGENANKKRGYCW